VIARHWLDGGRPDEAIDWLVAAARHAVKLGAFGDGLEYLETLLEHAPGHVDALCLRAEALEALGDERAPAAFAAAAQIVGEPAWHEIRAKQALASVRSGDPAGAVEALEGVEPKSLDGRLAQALALCGAAAMGFADPALGAVKAAETRRLAVESGDPAAIVIASWAEAAAAHARGDLPRSLRAELRATYALPQLAITVFDGQLCVVERLLYGAQPYADVIAFADALGSEAERLGAVRGQAFATTFRGEAKLLAGRLDEADDDLAEGARLHHAIGAAAGEAVSLQRRAEVALYRGRRSEADALLDGALDVARASNLGFHLLDRIYGTRIAAAADPASAMAALEEAESAVHGSMETCPGCRITLAVPAAIAAARAGDLERAAGYEAAAGKLTTILMRLPGWYAALDEVRGHRARATGDVVAAGAYFAAAAAGFRKVGQPLDANRCRALAANQS
jgi:tetratricopeptide (TPR) repeat protein